MGGHDGDGYEDLLISAQTGTGSSTDQGHAWRMAGPVTGGVSVSLADASWESDANGSNLGSGKAGGDFDGDGLADLALGDSGYDDPSSNNGAVFLFYGPVTGTVDVEDADLTVNGVDDDYIATGRSVEAGHSLLGTGGTELAIATWCFGVPCVAIVSTPVSGHGSSIGDADAFALGRSTAGCYYSSEDSLLATGDYDGDGVGDLIVGGPTCTSARVGEAFGVLGPFSGELDVPISYEACFESDSQCHPLCFATAGDVDGDGEDDAIFGLLDDRGGAYAGSAPLYYGPITGRYDLTGDGLDDVLVSAQHWDDGVLFVLSPAEW